MATFMQNTVASSSVAAGDDIFAGERFDGVSLPRKSDHVDV
jgi:hypothetical protein